MKVQITIQDDAGQTATWEATSDDQFDCWEAVGTTQTLDPQGEAMTEALQMAAYKAQE